MKKYIFTIAFALLGITSSMASKADTLRIYSIDGERIPNFTGKELIGKTIKNYQVNTNVLPAPKRDVIEIHIITTTTPRSIHHTPASCRIYPRLFFSSGFSVRLPSLHHILHQEW
jgi:hypothetical protein